MQLFKNYDPEIFYRFSKTFKLETIKKLNRPFIVKKGFILYRMAHLSVKLANFKTLLRT